MAARKTSGTSSTSKTNGRRSNGEGSITRRKDGLWRAQIRLGIRPDGRPDRRDIYGKTRKEVADKLAELRRRRDDGTLAEPAAEQQTVGEFLTTWLAASKSTVRLRTWERYGELVRLHLVPALGRTRLGALRPDQLQRLYAAKLDTGLSPRTVRYLHATLHRALNQAAKWGLLARNPATVVDPPALPQPELRALSPAEVARLLETAREAGDPLAPLWAVAFYSGCREGELLGLSWGDVDLERGRLTIRRTLIRATGGVPLFGQPKTRRSRRTITIPSSAVAILCALRGRQDDQRAQVGEAYHTHGLVFCSRTGTPLLPRNVIRRFKAALARAGLPTTVRFHDLRHAHATTLLAAGVHPKVASERLGHSSVMLTLDTYSHAVEGLDEDAAEKLQQELERARRTAD